MIEQTLEGNKLIAEFMGWELVNINEEPEDEDFDCWVFKNKETGYMDSGVDGQFYNKNSTLPFNTDWNLLMSAVDKIEDKGQVLLFGEIKGTQKVLKFHSQPWHCFGSDKFPITKKQAVYEAVIDMIKKFKEND